MRAWRLADAQIVQMNAWALLGQVPLTSSRQELHKAICCAPALCILASGRYQHTRRCRLGPGEEWYGELALRWRKRLWEAPVFGDGGPPLPQLPRQRPDELATVDEEEEMPDADYHDGVLGESRMGATPRTV